MTHDAFVGVRPLLRVSLRQDVRNLAPWIAVVAIVSASSLLAYTLVFDDPATLQTAIASAAANPAFNLIFGPARNLSSADGFNAWRCTTLGGFTGSLMAIFAVTRNSRAHEDSGQAELIASGVVGRHARLGAAVVVAWIAALALGSVSFLVMLAFGGGAASSLTLSATFAASAMIFAGIAAITAQLGSFARTANSIAVAVLGACFLVRGYADTSSGAGWTRWLSPLGWVEEAKPGAGNRWWPLLLCLVVALLLAGAGITLSGRRDFGQGIITPKPGPDRAGLVATPYSLAWRLQRSAIISWTAALVLLGAVSGTLGSSLEDLLADNPDLAKGLIASAGQTDLTFAFLLAVLNLLGVIAAVYGIQVILRIYVEEAQYRVEPLLAGAVSRTVFYASHIAIALIGPALALALGGLALGMTTTAYGADIEIADLIRQSAAALPAVWLLVGLAVALVGARPQVRRVAWFGVAMTFALTVLGPSLQLPDWLLAVSPLEHVPDVTSAGADLLPLLWLALVAGGSTVIGFIGYRHRDLEYEQP